jgi:hypothetical protein
MPFRWLSGWRSQKEIVTPLLIQITDGIWSIGTARHWWGNFSLRRWDVASVTWKRAVLARNDYVIGPYVKAERLEKAIADDQAWLAAHPTRRSNSEAMARRREFNEAMRQRIRDIAASRDLSDEEIRPVLRLKHHEIAKFTEKYGVNLEWLLEGKGRIFKSGAPQ